MKRAVAGMILMLLGIQFASGQVANLKLGIHHSYHLQRSPQVAAESRLGERLTFQMEFAYGHKGARQDRSSSSNSFHFGVDGRIYFAIRQKQYFSGFYTGPFISHDRTIFNAEGYGSAYFRRYSTSGGLQLGFQQPFWEHWRVDGGVRIGYRKGIWDEQLHPDGSTKSKTLHGFNVSAYSYLQLGYAF